MARGRERLWLEEPQEIDSRFPGTCTKLSLLVTIFFRTSQTIENGISLFQNTNRFHLFMNLITQPRFHAKPKVLFLQFHAEGLCTGYKIADNMFLTTFIVFLRSHSTFLDWSAKIFRKFPREYHCSQTSIVVMHAVFSHIISFHVTSSKF